MYKGNIEDLCNKYANVIAVMGDNEGATTLEILCDFGYTLEHLDLMAAALVKYPQYKDGLPFLDDSPEYKKDLYADLGLQLLQSAVDLDELPMDLYHIVPKTN